jgi:hypothetical protein
VTRAAARCLRSTVCVDAVREISAFQLTQSQTSSTLRAQPDPFVAHMEERLSRGKG